VAGLPLSPQYCLPQLLVDRLRDGRRGP
jgi:hypothetical protein